MSKAVLLSIHPKWAEKIYSGEKAVECRCKMKFSEPRPLSAYGLKRSPQS